MRSWDTLLSSIFGKMKRKMPNLTVYLQDQDYVKLYNRADAKHIKAARLARVYIEKGLKDEV